jgi:hypothetical protein
MNHYPIDIVIEYHDDSEYRNCINQLFGTNNSDEDYDEASATLFLDYVYKLTKTNYFIKKLYILAAATMMSTDQNLGLSVLFSYNYLNLFHKFLVHYFTSKTTYKKDIEQNESYVELLNMFSK